MLTDATLRLRRIMDSPRVEVEPGVAVPQAALIGTPGVISGSSGGTEEGATVASPTPTLTVDQVLAPLPSMSLTAAAAAGNTSAIQSGAALQTATGPGVGSQTGDVTIQAWGGANPSSPPAGAVNQEWADSLVAGSSDCGCGCKSKVSMESVKSTACRIGDWANSHPMFAGLVIAATYWMLSRKK